MVMVVSLSVATVVMTSSAMPPQPGASGLADSCQRCHVNCTSSSEAGASLTFEGVPHRYEPGNLYNVRVVLDRGRGPFPSFDILHAFQLGVKGGTLEAVNASFVTIDESEVGSRGASEATEWTVVWTAPAEGDAHFFAEAVVADGDGTPEGDVRLEARALSYGPLDVLPSDPPGVFEGRAVLALAAAMLTILVILLLVLTHLRPPPRELD
jgi:hypothetical protein